MTRLQQMNDMKCFDFIPGSKRHQVETRRSVENLVLPKHCFPPSTAFSSLQPEELTSPRFCDLPARLPGTHPPAPAPGSTLLQPTTLLSPCGSRGAAQPHRAGSSVLSQNVFHSGQSGSSLRTEKDHSTEKVNMAKGLGSGLGLLGQAGSCQEELISGPC